MKDVRRRGLAEWLIAVCGAWLTGLGFYFVFLRPALLPEDARFIGSSLAQIRMALPGLEGWLHQVLAVTGGFIAGTGVFTLFLAWVAMPVGLKGTSWVVALTGALTVALMSVTNFTLNSDFRWLLLVPVLVWLAGLVVHVARRTRQRDRSY